MGLLGSLAWAPVAAQPPPSTVTIAYDQQRVQIDTASRTWTSDFRGLATSQGGCE